MSDTITISREDFKNITSDILRDTLKDGDLEGQAMFLIPMMKIIFAHELESKLFDEKEEEEKNE